MRIPRLIRSRWVRIPLMILTALMLAGAGWVGFRLGTTLPAMYHPAGVADAPPCAPEEPAETIVYTSLRPGNLDVYLFDALDAPPRRVAEHPNLDYKPVLSHGGQWVVFASDRDGTTNLYALDTAAGGEPIALTTHPAMDNAPTLSPDGSLVAFVSTRGGAPDIWVMPFAPGDPRAEAQAVNLTRSPQGDFNPAFSPDGSRIAFASNRGVFRRWNPLRLVPTTEVVTDLYVMDRDGSNLRRVVRALGVSGSPSWTEDGTALLFYKATGPAASGVYRTPLRGRGTLRLSPDSLAAFTPTAGPNGTVIFAATSRGTPPAGPSALQPGGRLFQVNADGTGLRALTEPGVGLLAPHYDVASGRLVAYGDGPVEESRRMANGTPFTWPGAVRTVRLAERCVRLYAMRSYFPSVDGEAERVFGVQWVHERNGVPPGPSPIVSATLDGGDLRVVHAPTGDGFMWSPVVTRDGAWVYYSQGARFGAVDTDVGIWKVRTDGSGATHLTADSPANDAFPDVSASGEWVAFRSGRDGRPGSGRRGTKEVYVMDRDGQRVRRVTHAPGNDTMPAISPDGEWVVFTTDRTGRGMKLWIQSLTDPDDTGRLLEPERARLHGADMHPRFSPDGRWVVFTSDRAGYMDEVHLSGMFPQPYGELYAVPLDGSGPTVRLTHDQWEDGLPFWGSAPRESR